MRQRPRVWNGPTAEAPHPRRVPTYQRTCERNAPAANNKLVDRCKMPRQIYTRDTGRDTVMTCLKLNALLLLEFVLKEYFGDLRMEWRTFIDTEQRIHTRQCKQADQAFCVFEYIYFAREDSIIHKRLVASERVRMGRALGRTLQKAQLDPDIIIDVPASAYYFASGCAEEMGVPYRRGLSKNNHVGRSFITPTQKSRELLVRQKLNPIRDVVRGRKVAVVDDSIVRGTTSKHLVKQLRASGAEKVFFVSASPPIKHPCIYGIDMSIRREIIAARYDVEDIAGYLGADAVVYQELDDLQSLYSDLPCCDACFSGNYPTEVSPELLDDIEREKTGSNRA